MTQFDFLSAESILLDSFKLGAKLYNTGFVPTHAISLWRGGTPVGLGLGEYFRLKGHYINHTTVATASYHGINTQDQVIIKGLEHLIKVIAREDRLLIIDDIYDSGRTIEAVINAIRQAARANCPEEIVVASIHNKDIERDFSHRVVSLKDVKPGTWISYPHEISDLVMESDREHRALKAKSPAIYEIINSPTPFPREELNIKEDFVYLHPDRLLEDSLKLAVNIFSDGFRPDFIIATWPGGIGSGLPIHEYFRYRHKLDCPDLKIPDHIAINTSLSHYSYRTNIIGNKYLEDNINRNDRILLIDSNFSSGLTVNHTIEKLQTLLRRNINVENVRVASVYYHPKKDVTRTTLPYVTSPYYYLKKIDKTPVFPHQIHRLPDPLKTLESLNSELKRVIYG